jgi:hypothetical protein
MSKKLTTEEFIKKANIKHNNEYDYSVVEYIYNKIKIKIICRIHGIFEQRPNDHLTKHGCPECAIIKRTNIRKKPKDKFIADANLVHSNKYDYSQTKYINNKTLVEIICHDHGKFNQRPNCHLNGAGCPKCGMEKLIKSISLTQDEFIKRAEEKHLHKYDYTNTKYCGARNKIRIICPKHGEFTQLPYDHLNGSGCKKCVESSGERTIRNFLEKNHINYIYEKLFDNCINILPLPFDFYLPEKNILIEYDGIQHYKSLKFFGGENGLLSMQKRDNIKTNYAQANNINLIRIAYNENVEEKLSEIL